MSDSNQFEVNFFKPLSDHARANRGLILVLAIIWAVAVFGFQFLLMWLNQPSPEDSYENFTSVYPAVIERNAENDADKIIFSKALLHIMGKNIAVSDADKAIVKTAFSWTVKSMLNDSLKQELFQLDEASFLLAANTIKLENEGFDKIMRDLLPFSLVKVDSETFPEECRAKLPGIMELYLIHNRSFLTDFTFLGFPFHYWYTAQFLLILFVVLCIIYAVRIEKANSKHNFVEET